MARTYFITTQKLAQLGFIHGNVEDSILLNCIWRAQEYQLQPVLGSPLYRKLKEKIAEWETAGSGSGDYYDLMVNYVVPALVPIVEIKATFHTTTEIENKGTGKNKDEHFQANSVEDNNNLRDEISKDYVEARNLLIRHLCDDNGVKYPEYLERTGNAEDYLPEDSGPNYEDEISII